MPKVRTGHISTHANYASKRDASKDILLSPSRGRARLRERSHAANCVSRARNSGIAGAPAAKGQAVNKRQRASGDFHGVPSPMPPMCAAPGTAESYPKISPAKRPKKERIRTGPGGAKFPNSAAVKIWSLFN